MMKEPIKQSDAEEAAADLAMKLRREKKLGRLLIDSQASSAIDWCIGYNFFFVILGSLFSF